VKRAKHVAEPLGDEAARLGRAVLRADITRHVATAAAIGTGVALPIPLVGSAAGAAVGAGIGLYKNLNTSKGGSGPMLNGPVASRDEIADLERLDDLRQRGVLTDEEFQSQKRKLLRR
jgi:hypothetical protein